MVGVLPRLVNAENGDTLTLRHWTITDVFDYEEEHDATEKLLDHGGRLHERRIGTKNWSITAKISYNFLQVYIDYFRRNHFQELQFYINGRYMKCDLISYETKDISEGYYELQLFTLHFVSYDPFWTQEAEVSIEKTEGSAGGKHYYNNFPYEYGKELATEGFVLIPPAYNDFIITMYGPVMFPRLEISNGKEDKLYRFFVKLEEGERLVLDNMKRSIIHYRNDGSEVEVYGLRDKTVEDIFQRVPTGNIEYMSNFDGKLQVFANDFHSDYGAYGVESNVLHKIKGVVINDNGI